MLIVSLVGDSHGQAKDEKKAAVGATHNANNSERCSLSGSLPGGGPYHLELDVKESLESERMYMEATPEQKQTMVENLMYNAEYNPTLRK